MKNEINFGGVNYVSATDAAEEVGLSRDYIARLCKWQKVVCRKVGTHWYVSVDSMNAFMRSQQFAQEKRRAELSNEFAGQRVKNLLSSAYEKMPQPLGVEVADNSRIRLEPVGERQYLQRVVAITIAVLFTIGTYAFVDTQYSRTVLHSVPRSTELFTAARGQLAAAASDPIGTLSNSFVRLARFVNNGVNSALGRIVYSRVSPGSSVPSQGLATSRSTASSSVLMNDNAVSASSASRSRAADISSPTRVLERVVETQRVVVQSGGLTEEILNAKLAQLDSKLTSQIFGVSSQTSANTTQIVNNYNAVGGALRIDELDDITLSDSTITGGSISGTRVSATSLTVTGTGTSTFSGGIQAPYLNLSGTSATSTFAKGIDITDGCFSIDGTCVTGSGGSGTPGGSDTQVQFNDNSSFAGSSSFTFSSSTSLLKVTNASSTRLSIFDRLHVGGSATTTIQGDTTGTSTVQGFLNVAGTNSTSTFSGALATTYLNVSGTAATSTFARGIDLAGGCFSMNGTCLVSNSQLLSSANTWTALQTINFASSTSLAVSGTGFFGTASSTNLVSQYASTSVLTVDRNAYFTNLSSALLGVDSTGKLVSTTTIGNSLLNNGGALTVNTTGPLGGGGSVALGGSLTLTCSTCSTASDPFTHTSYASLTTSATTSAFRTTSLLAASTTDFTYASTSQLTNSGNTYLTALTSALLATDSTGQVVSTTTIGNSLFTTGGVRTITTGW